MIVFRNRGVLDVRALTTFGLSVKGPNSIGRFGTGLKYAVAVILRNGGSLTITAGVDRFTFETRTEKFRDVDKAFIYMLRNGEEPRPLGFTTDLGRDWQEWQAFREFYSNCKDENGELAHRADEDLEAVDGETIIAVCHRPFDAIFFALEQYFIGAGEVPLWENDDLAIYPGRSKYIFYQGICVYELKEPAAFRYDVKRYIDLTEDRTAKYSWQIISRIVENIPHCDNAKVCGEVLAPGAAFEREFDYTKDFSGIPSPAFSGAVVSSKGDCPLSAAQLVRMTLPDSASEVNIAAPGTKGASQLSNAVVLAMRAGLDKSGITFVLGIGLPVVGDFTVRDKNLILSEAILEDQEKMNIAVIQGIAEICSRSPRSFMAQTIIRLVQCAAHDAGAN